MSHSQLSPRGYITVTVIAAITDSLAAASALAFSLPVESRHIPAQAGQGPAGLSRVVLDARRLQRHGSEASGISWLLTGLASLIDAVSKGKMPFSRAV